MALQREVLDRILTEVLSDGDTRLQEVLLMRHDCRTLAAGVPQDLQRTLDEQLDLAYSRMPSCSPKDSYDWRKLYTDFSLAFAVSVLQTHPTAPAAWQDVIFKLDKAVVLAGAPGKGRYELVMEIISAIQMQHLLTTTRTSDGRHLLVDYEPSPPPLAITTAGSQIIRTYDPPSFTSFVSHFSKRPFVLPGFAKDWPALNKHSWSSITYLQSIAGPARQVPVEVGADYRTDEWTQRLMEWDSFLSALERPSRSDEVVYLAQHDLFKQFPALLDDIIVPDYVYTSLEASIDYPEYTPPLNSDQLVMNVWLGPKGAISPAHTDPFHNFYTQVVGSKTVWLAPPSCTPYMSVYGSDDDQGRKPAANKQEGSMSNTSRIDVFSSEQLPASFGERVIPNAMAVTLQPGDMLFFPAGWWHAMRSETTSFSVSMWF